MNLGRRSLVASCGLPESSTGPVSSASIFGLAPRGVYLAARVTPGTGGLLLHRFTLTAGRSRWRSALCCTFPGVAPAGGYPARCPMEFRLSSAGRTRQRLRLSLSESSSSFRLLRGCAGRVDDRDEIVRHILRRRKVQDALQSRGIEDHVVAIVGGESLHQRPQL